MTPKKYRKRPVVIEAMQWDGMNIEAALEFMAPIEALPNPDGHVQSGVGYVPAIGQVDIPTLEGTMSANPGDWIIKGVAGEFYPCKPDIFAATYEEVTA